MSLLDPQPAQQAAADLLILNRVSSSMQSSARTLYKVSLDFWLRVLCFRFSLALAYLGSYFIFSLHIWSALGGYILRAFEAQVIQHVNYYYPIFVLCPFCTPGLVLGRRICLFHSQYLYLKNSNGEKFIKAFAMCLYVS